MKKFILFIICLLLSAGVLALSLISNSIVCAKSQNKCIFITKIQYLNIELNREEFSPESLKNINCEKKVQPSKKGKKNYYLLKLNINERPYNISTFAKYKECKTAANEIKKDIKDNGTDSFVFGTSSGVTNVLGTIFAFIIFIVGIIILRTDEEPQEPLDEDDI